LQNYTLDGKVPENGPNIHESAWNTEYCTKQLCLQAFAHNLPINCRAAMLRHYGTGRAQAMATTGSNNYTAIRPCSPVGLVDHQARQISVNKTSGVLQVVQQSSGCTDEQIDALNKLLSFSAPVGASDTLKGTRWR
jgi:hypothetical protein